MSIIDFDALEQAEARGSEVKLLDAILPVDELLNSALIRSEECHGDNADERAGLPTLEEMLARMDADEGASNAEEGALSPMASTARLPAEDTSAALASANLQIESPDVSRDDELSNGVAIPGTDCSPNEADEQADVPSLEELLGRIDAEEAATEAVTPAVPSSLVIDSVAISNSLISEESPKYPEAGFSSKLQEANSGTWSCLNTSENAFLRGKRTPHHILVAQKILRAHTRRQTTVAAASGESPPAIANHRGLPSKGMRADPQPARDVPMPEAGVPERLPGMPTLPTRSVFPRNAVAVGATGPSLGKSAPSAAVPVQSQRSDSTACRAVPQQPSSMPQDEAEDGLPCTHCRGRVLRPLRCSRCRCVHYCCSQCQRADWPSHKKACKVHESVVLSEGVLDLHVTDQSSLQQPACAGSEVSDRNRAAPSLEEMLAQLDQEEFDSSA